MKVSLPKGSQSSGQVVLITLLVMAVVLTIGLSIASRSITDIKTSQQTQEAARAFWVAQAGLEKAIKANSEITDTLNNVHYSVSMLGLGGGSEYLYPVDLSSDDTATIWLVDHSGDQIGSNFANPDYVAIYWGRSSAQNTALEATFIYQVGGAYKVNKVVYSPGDTSGNQFTSVNPGVNNLLGRNFTYKTPDIDTSGYSNLYLVRLRTYGNTAAEPVAIRTNVAIPSQGNCFVSTATIGESNITKKLQECRLWKEPPSIFDFAIYSGGAI